MEYLTFITSHKTAAREGRKRERGEKGGRERKRKREREREKQKEETYK